MKTFLLIVPLILFSLVAWKVSLFALNIVGFPGALIAGTSNKRQSIAGVLRFIIGVITSTLCQAYVYLAFVAFIVNFTRHAVHGEGVIGPVLWPVAFIASFAPIYLCAAAGTVGGQAGFSEWNAQVYAVVFNQVIALIGFFVFAFSPSVILLGWPWIPYGSQ